MDGATFSALLDVVLTPVALFVLTLAVLWEISDDCKNWGVLRGHKNAVLEVHWAVDGQYVCDSSPYAFASFLTSLTPSSPQENPYGFCGQDCCAV